MFKQEKRLKSLIRKIINEMAVSFHQDFKNAINPTDNPHTQHFETPLDPKLQNKTTTTQKWEKDVSARLKRYEGVHVYVYKFTTNFNLATMLSKYLSFDSQLTQDNDSYITSNGGERTLFIDASKIDKFISFFKMWISRDAITSQSTPEFLDAMRHNIQQIEKIKKDIQGSENKCALISVSSSNIPYNKFFRDLNTGWIAIHKLFDDPVFLNFLSAKFNIQIQNPNNPDNSDAFSYANSIMRKIVDFNDTYKKDQGKNRQYIPNSPNQFQVQPVSTQPYNFKFQDKKQPGSNYYYSGSNKINPFDYSEPIKVSNLIFRDKKAKELGINPRTPEGLSQIKNIPVSQDELITKRPIQDFLPEMITYALGWFMGKEGDQYIVWDWNEDISQGQVKRMNSREVTLRFFQTDAYDLTSDADIDFIEKELMPFFEGVVIRYVENIWNYFKGKIIINVN